MIKKMIGQKISYRKAPQGCTPDSKNPFSEDGKYGHDWTGFVLGESDTSFIGTSKSGLFLYKYGRNNPNIEAIVADFLRYENEYSREPIMFFPENMDIDSFISQAIDVTPQPHIIRDTDPKYLVHSTNLEAGKQILQDQEIKSLSRLSLETINWHKLRSDSLGEPPDYAHHINFGSMENPWVECVPASHAAGRFLTPDDPYSPGFRFYFDGHKIINDGLDVRLAGALQVRDKLPLNPYLIMAVGLDDVDPQKKIISWTPRLFTEQANKIFSKQHAT